MPSTWGKYVVNLWQRLREPSALAAANGCTRWRTNWRYLCPEHSLMARPQLARMPAVALIDAERWSASPLPAPLSSVRSHWPPVRLRHPRSRISSRHVRSAPFHQQAVSTETAVPPGASHTRSPLEVAAPGLYPRASRSPSSSAPGRGRSRS